MKGGNEVEPIKILVNFAFGVFGVVLVVAGIRDMIVDEKNEWLFEDSHSTSILEKLEILAMVQECQDQFSSLVIETLFMNTEGANPKSVKPDGIVGWPWHQFVRIAMDVSEQKHLPINPLAIVKNGKSSSCPSFETEIERGDSIIIITNNGFDWEAFENALVEKAKAA